MSTGLFQDEEEGYNLEETKYKLKLDAPSEPALPASGGEENLDSLADLGSEDLGGEPQNDKPFDDQPFDAGIEADEDAEPEKYIQQLAGKLGTTLRSYSDERGQPDFDLEKFAINSVISATHSAEMDEEDQNDIINKIKNSGVGDDMGGEEPGMDMPNDDGGMDAGGLDNADTGSDKPDMELPDEELEETLYENEAEVDNSPFRNPDVEKTNKYKEELRNYTNKQKDYGEKFNEEECGLGDDLEEQAVRKPEEETKPNIHVYHQDPNAEGNTEKDINELHNTKKNRIFVENTMMPIIKQKLAELGNATPEPITKPVETPTETPSPRRKKIWEVQPAVSPKPKAQKATIGFNENKVVVDSLKVENFKTQDYPEFIDASITYGEYSDGTPLTESELKTFQNNNIEAVREIIYERLF